jgi:hypothetical protein
MGVSSVRTPLTRTGPHTRTHTMPIKHTVPPPPLTHTHDTRHEQRTMGNAHAPIAHSAQHTRLDTRHTTCDRQSNKVLAR